MKKPEKIKIIKRKKHQKNQKKNTKITKITYQNFTFVYNIVLAHNITSINE